MFFCNYMLILKYQQHILCELGQGIKGLRKFSIVQKLPVWNIPQVNRLSLFVFVFFLYVHSDHCWRAWPRKREALEGWAGCEETNGGSEVPADKGQWGERPSEHGPAHHRQVRRKAGQTRRRTCAAHTSFHMNRCNSSKADIMMKGIIELVSMDFCCQLHNGFSSISTLFIFCIGSPETSLILEQWVTILPLKFLTVIVL